MSEQRLTPGLMVIHGNHPEALRDLLVQWMSLHPLAPLENEVILVQSNGIAQWLKLALGRDVEEGGCGVTAALDVQLPAQFLWRAYRGALGRESIPEVSVLDKGPLTWRLMRLLPGPCWSRASSPPCSASSPTMPTCASATSWPSAWPTCSTSTRCTAPTGWRTGAAASTSCAWPTAP